MLRQRHSALGSEIKSTTSRRCHTLSCCGNALMSAGYCVWSVVNDNGTHKRCTTDSQKRHERMVTSQMKQRLCTRVHSQNCSPLPPSNLATYPLRPPFDTQLPLNLRRSLPRHGFLSKSKLVHSRAAACPPQNTQTPRSPILRSSTPAQPRSIKDAPPLFSRKRHPTSSTLK